MKWRHGWIFNAWFHIRKKKASCTNELESVEDTVTFSSRWGPGRKRPGKWQDQMKAQRPSPHLIGYCSWVIEQVRYWRWCCGHLSLGQTRTTIITTDNMDQFTGNRRKHLTNEAQTVVLYKYEEVKKRDKGNTIMKLPNKAGTASKKTNQTNQNQLRLKEHISEETSRLFCDFFFWSTVPCLFWLDYIINYTTVRQTMPALH